MTWNTQRGGPWGGGGGGGGGGQGPWGGGGSTGPQPPDIEEILRRGQDRVKRFIPSGGGGVKQIGFLVLAAIIVWLGFGIYKIQPEEEGVVLIFGKWRTTTEQGLHWNLPWPIGQILKPKVTRVQQTEIGFRTGFDTRRGGEATRSLPRESLMLTGDENIIDIRFVTFWRIKDAGKYLFNIRNPDTTVRQASESAMREILGKSEFEFARTKGRASIDGAVKTLLQGILDDFGAGISVNSVRLQKIDPPGNVLTAFRDVQAARADKERAVNEATAYRNEVVNQAEGEAARITNAAEAYKAEKIAVATGEANRFVSVLDEYRKDKVVTRRRLYLETMKAVMRGMDKVLIDKQGSGGSGVVPYLPLSELGKREKEEPAK